MATTRGSLLLRLKNPDDDTAWKEFYHIYTPLLYWYARRRGLARADAEEVRDQCLEVVARKIQTFDYRKEKGGFRNWLRRIAENKVVDLLRKHREQLANSHHIRKLRDPELSPAEIWDQQWRTERLKYCVKQVQASVSERDYRVFRMLLLDERSVKEVCQHFGVNANQVYKAKARVLKQVSGLMAKLDSDVAA